MAQLHTDIAIFGAGIAGLWLLNRLRAEGYNAVLFEKNAIGSGQTIASQGIIHSGLKFALAGKVSSLAKSLSDVPQRWRACLGGSGEIDLSRVEVAAPFQMLMVPRGLVGNIVNLATKKTFGDGVAEIPRSAWSQDICKSGFNGSLISMDELVLDIPSVIKALAEPHRDCIFKIEDEVSVDAQLYIYSAADSNAFIAHNKRHDKGLEVQHRPLLMGMMKNAPFPLFAHLVGASEKPVATITTHQDSQGHLIWYLGAGVAERAKDADPQEVYEATRKALAKYMPNLDLSNIEWATLPIDRVEGKSKTDGWMPDTPTIHEAKNHLYCWPTKLTFAPMLADMIIDKIHAKGIISSKKSMSSVDLPLADYAQTPWDEVKWKSEN